LEILQFCVPVPTDRSPGRQDDEPDGGQDIHEFNTKESRPYRLAVSHGAALYDPESQTSLEELISAADELMYVQKRAKGSR